MTNMEDTQDQAAELDEAAGEEQGGADELATLREELAAVKEELAKAKTQLKVARVEGRQTAEQLASQVGDEAMFGGDPNRVNTELAKIEAVTAADIQAVADRYLQPQRATRLFIKPDPLGKEGRAAASQAARTADAPPVEGDPALRRRPQAHDRAQRRRLAGAVAAEEHRHLPCRHLEVDAVEDVVRADVRVHA